jgi:hypothetical protein
VAQPDTTAPTVISTDLTNLGSGVATNQKATATFSQGMDSTTLTGTTFTLTGGRFEDRLRALSSNTDCPECTSNSVAS